MINTWGKDGKEVPLPFLIREGHIIWIEVSIYVKMLSSFITILLPVKEVERMENSIIFSSDMRMRES